MFELYKLDFEATGKSYIGITTRGANKRYKGHANGARNGRDSCVCRAWRKHGAPTIQVLAILNDMESLLQAEIKAIAVYKTMVPEGYNLIEGGGASPTLNKTVAKKVSSTNKGLWKDPEFRAKMIAATSTPEFRSKISLSSKSMWESESYRAYQTAINKENGKNHEICAKKSKSHKELWKDQAHRLSQVKAIKLAARNPQRIIKSSDSKKLWWKNPDNHESQVASIKKGWQKPSSKKAKSSATKSLWERPEYRKAKTEASKALWKNPDHRSKMLEVLRANRLAMAKSREEAS